MILAFEEIIKNSFVVTIDNKRFNAFKDAFLSAGFSEKLLPKKFIGYEISNEYLINTFKPIFDLQFSKVRGYLEQEFEKFHCIFNSASHCAIVQHAMLLDLPFVTIFEDDAVPVKDCVEKLNSYCSNVPNDTDVLRLGYLPPRKEMFNKNYKWPEPEANGFIVSRFPGSHAYIVFKKYYQRFLENNKIQPRCDKDRINPSQDKVVYALREPLFEQINILDAPVIHAYRLKDGKIKLPPVH